MSNPRFAFIASTGRTATMFLASTLDSLAGVRALHEGHDLETSAPQLPVINLQNRQAWDSHDTASSIVQARRSAKDLEAAANGNALIVDAAFYNAPLLRSLRAVHPRATFLVIVRRCESFVRSATIVDGEDLQPAGWPDPAKDLTDRERFIELGRHRPAPDSEDGEHWPSWSAIQRNIWLWTQVNCRLHDHYVRGEATLLRFEDLREAPELFWESCLSALDVDEALSLCVERSTTRVNARSAYQTDGVSTWSHDEQDMYNRLAMPLEAELYDTH